MKLAQGAVLLLALCCLVALGCDPGWTYHDNSCYKESATEGGWASTQCTGSDLATDIDNIGTLAGVLSMVNGEVFVGCSCTSDCSNGASWTWTGTKNPVSAPPKATGGTGQKCCVLRSGGIESDSCDTSRRHLCKQPLGSGFCPPAFERFGDMCYSRTEESGTWDNETLCQALHHRARKVEPTYANEEFLKDLQKRIGSQSMKWSYVGVECTATPVSSCKDASNWVNMYSRRPADGFTLGNSFLGSAGVLYPTAGVSSRSPTTKLPHLCALPGHGTDAPATPTPPSAQCEAGWVEYQGKCYSVSQDAGKCFEDAPCKSVSPSGKTAGRATVQDTGVRKFLLSSIDLGLARHVGLRCAGKCVWDDGTTYSPHGLWNINSPDPSKDCVSLVFNGLLSTVVQDLRFKHICEYNLYDTATPAPATPSPPTTLVQGACEASWWYYQGKCYQMSMNPGTWSNPLCGRGTLATVESASVLGHVLKLPGWGMDWAYFNLKCGGSGGSCQLDNPASYSSAPISWASGYPRTDCPNCFDPNGNVTIPPECGVLRYSTWEVYNAPCDYGLLAVCAYDAAVPPPPPPPP
eukprot:Sspe_Gene.95738::Locus_68038_Transcript_1_1_Confidence_1.000_Length_1781::g.95738::m.95738